MAEQRKYCRIGAGVDCYMNVHTHPGAIVAWRPDARNGRAMTAHGMLGEPFDADPSSLLTCSDEFCAGNYFLAEYPHEWSQHLARAHTASRPYSRLGELQATLAATLSAYDKAVDAERRAAVRAIDETDEAERAARTRREELEAEVRRLRDEIARVEHPKPVPVAAAGAKKR